MTMPRAEKARDWRANERPGRPRRRLPPERPRDLLQAWLDHFSSKQLRRPAEAADGCWPQLCTCGFIDLVDRTRRALR